MKNVIKKKDYDLPRQIIDVRPLSARLTSKRLLPGQLADASEQLLFQEDQDNCLPEYVKKMRT